MSTDGPEATGRVGRRTFLQALGVGTAASLLPWGATAAASGQVHTAASGTYGPEPPLMHGYSATDVKAWRPETDKYAAYLRATVPLARRIPAFEPTQARRGLDPRPKLMSLANDYVQPGHVTEGYPHGHGFEAYALRFWQYPDLYASWHGLPLAGEHDAEQPRYGIINLPNPGYTSAAHRNGVLSLGCWFWPRPEDFDEVLERRPDGSFPMVDKLIEMAQYFGFDGYFINQEAQIQPDQAVLLMEFFRYAARTAPQGFHLQWYDSLTMAGAVRYQNEFNWVNSPWIKNVDGERICDSIFLNYWWDELKLQRSKEHALLRGLDPYEVVFAGQEIGSGRFGQRFDPQHIFPAGDEPRTSWAYLGAEMVWYTVEGAKDTVEAQRPAYERERHLWCGPLQDPSRTGRLAQPNWRAPLDPKGWDGTAHYIVEKSVIGSVPFVTSFCAGTGTEFFIDGQQVSDQPWFDIGIQDVLPTWQWWVRDGDDRPSESVTCDYDYTTAVDGGSSLKISGALDAGESAVVRLYKTALAVERSTQVEVAYRSDGDVLVELGVIYADAPDRWQWLPLDGTVAQPAGWSRSSHALDASRTVAAIGIAVRAATGTDVAVHLGQLVVSDGGSGRPPLAPSGLEIDHVARDGDVASVYLQWSASDGAAYYDLFHGEDGDHIWVGRTFGEAFCASVVTRPTGASRTPVEVQAVDVYGKRGRPARVWLDW